MKGAEETGTRTEETWKEEVKFQQTGTYTTGVCSEKYSKIVMQIEH